MKNDFDFQKRRADVLEKEVDRKKNELFMQAKELEKVYIENERVKDDLQYIQSKTNSRAPKRQKTGLSNSLQSSLSYSIALNNILLALYALTR
jgi:phosphoenolpyruvate synthase/pyruvate phosphate dikinase